MKKLSNTEAELKRCFKKNEMRRSGVFIVNFEHISHLVLGFL